MSVSNLEICRQSRFGGFFLLIVICHLGTTAYDLQRSNRNAVINERPVTEGHCTVMQPVSRGTTRPDLEENAGKLAREVKPLMHHSSDVCLPLPNVPATFGQHI